MQGKVRHEFHVSSRPMEKLDHMNLGEVVPLSEEEERLFKCHDRSGRVVRGLYAAPVSTAVSPTAFGSRTCTFRDGASQGEGNATLKMQAGGGVSVCDMRPKRV